MLTPSSPVTFDAVQAQPWDAADAQYQYGGDDNQFAELWLPPPSARPAPVVVLVHGGCWLAEYDIGHIRALATRLAQAGYAVWALEYRRVGQPGGGWPNTASDVFAGIDYLRELADPRLDLGRIALVGHSAGGQLALLAGGRERLPVSHPLHRADPMPVGGVVGLAAITDLVAYAGEEGSCPEAVPRLMGGMPAALPAAYAQASPLALARNVPVVLLQGTADSIVPLSQAQSLADASLRLVPDAGHFDLVHADTPAFAVLLEVLGSMLVPIPSSS